MAKVTPILTSFASGEFSPLLDGRVDISAYYSSAKTLENFLIMPHGGIYRRPGFHYVAETKDSTRKARLIPFEFNVEQAYVLEFGQEYMRVFKNHGQVLENADSYTKLLLHMDGADASTTFTDSGITGHTVTAYGTAQLDIDYKVFGTSSGLFGGTGSAAYLSIADHADFDLSAGIWTIDFRARFNGYFASKQIFYQGTDVNNFISIYQSRAGTSAANYRHVINFQIVSAGGVVVSAAITEPSHNDWEGKFIHIAFAENGDDWYAFAEGELQSTFEDTDRASNYTGLVYIAANSTPGDYFQGHLDEFRISNGIARWTADFAPPTQEYPLPDEGAAAVEIATPYLEEDLAALKKTQSADTMYIVHPSYAPRKLTRTSHVDWTLTEIDFIDGPYRDEQATPALTPSHTSADGTEKVTNGGFDADSDWVKGGADWTIAGGKAVHAATGANTLSQDTTEANTEIYRVIFTLSGLTAGKSVTVSIGGVAGTARDANGTYTEYITATGVGNLTFTPGDAATACVIDDVSVVKVITLTAASALFDSGHVGSLWRIKHTAAWGYVKIESYVSSTVVRAITKADLDGSGTAVLSYAEGAWSDYRGWPTAVMFHEERLWFARDLTIWGSHKGDGYYEDFESGTDDEDPVAFTLNSDRVNLIRWLSPSRKLIVGTAGEEFTVDGGDTFISATNVNAKVATTHGSADIQPLKIGTSVLFVQRSGRKLRELVYNYEIDGYLAPDMTLLAEHISEPKIIGMDYQQETDPTIWAVRSDGVLLSMAYMRPEDVIGWARHPMDNGEVESIAVIPTPDESRDELWAIVKRTLNGSVVRCVEYMDPDLLVDCAITYSGVAVTSVSGLDHLEGETVQVVGDGMVYLDAEVTSGAITLSPVLAASEIQVGLAYTSYAETMRPEVSLSNGTSMGMKKAWGDCFVALLETGGCTINDEVIIFRTSGDPIGEAVPLYTGDKKVNQLGWNKNEGRIIIEQTEPLPCTVLAIFGNLEIGG